MDLLEGIFSRRSVREFTSKPVDADTVRQILKAGSWAPSGLNNQPWRFVVVRETDCRKKLSCCTEYGRIIENAPVCIAVFMDKEAGYDTRKDHQSIGACLQNMLLASHALGLGAVWLGEILKNAERVRELLGLTNRYELMAVIALGHPTAKKRRSDRRELSDLLLKEI